MTWVPALLVAVPAAAALVGLAVHRSRPAARATAVGSAALVSVLGGIEVLRPAGSSTLPTLGRLPAGELDVPLHLLGDRLSGMVALVVGLVVLAVQVYATWYLSDDRRPGVFHAAVSLFAAGMLLVVHSADLVLTLVGWEVMGWCSWLLIGHHSDRPGARRAAFKAFLVTRVADIGMVIGLVALAAGAGSTDLITVLDQPAAPGLVTVGLVGVIVGVAGKSGLVPFHDWLPDAMEGPTPASALIHAATMVAAGTYVLARLFPLFAQDGTARTLLAVLAAVTMVWAGALAFLQADLKRLLAYSTLSQVALMLSALAVVPAPEGPGAGVGHLVGHAFFKALLFLAAGWLAAIAGGTSLVLMRGRLQHRGALRWAVGTGLAALAGLPPTIGFVTKDGVVSAALAGIDVPGGAGRAALVSAAAILTLVLTAAYCTRVWLLLDVPVRRPRATTVPAPADAADPLTVHAMPAISRPALGAVMVLVVLTFVATPLLATVTGALHLDAVVAAVSVALVVATALVVRRLAGGRSHDAADSLPLRLRAAGVAGFGADRALGGIGSIVVRIARVTALLERDVVDAYPRATAVITRAAGRAGERAHRGVPSVGLLGVLAGMVLLVALGWQLWR